VVGPNQPPRPYRGGPGIARLRGLPALAQDRPEDFVASTTPILGSDTIGLSVLADGRSLRAHIEADPTGFLGPAHVARYGDDTGLLVKLLNPTQRLFVHFHPDASFAARHLNCRNGKSEGWIITDVAPTDGTETAHVYLGFRDSVDTSTVESWVAGQRVPAMLDAMNRIAVRPGDTFFVPAGIPHAIGAGITAVELQEPTDFSILLEWTGFDIPPQARHLGLGYEVALSALDRAGFDAARLAELGMVRAAEDPAVTRIFPADADRFFRAERVQSRTPTTFEPGYTILIVLDGDGTLTATTGTVDLHRGTCVLVPFGAGEYRISAAVDVIRCLPPAP
jgi:mannose-6-phosphate isomerase